ncbi:MAG: hypothetical protein V1816_14235 [Pseudomonadota bacterium]
MKGLDALFYWLAVNFTGERYLFYTKVQGLLWSLADIILVFALLKLADAIRKAAGRKTIKIRYGLLLFSALLTPLLIPARSPEHIFFIESLVCGLQFLILASTLASESRGVMEYLANKTARFDRGPAPGRAGGRPNPSPPAETRR